MQVFKNFPDQPFPDSVMEMLEQGIDDSDMVVVQGALMCLGQIGKQQFKSEEAIRILAKSLSSQNVALIFSASRALADIPNPWQKTLYGHCRTTTLIPDSGGC